MKNLSCVLIIMGFFILGCSHTYVLDKESRNEFAEQLNKKTRKKEAVIQTRDGKKYNAEEIWFLLDSTSWRDPTTNSYKTRSNSELYKIVINDHGKGAVEGLGLGVLSGFAGGFVLGYLASSESEYFGRAGTATITGTALGVLGGFLGLIGGSASGDKNIFMFDESTELSPKYYILQNVLILNEEKSSMQVRWQNKIVWLEKAKITILKQDDGVNI